MDSTAIFELLNENIQRLARDWGENTIINALREPSSPSIRQQQIDSLPLLDRIEFTDQCEYEIERLRLTYGNNIIKEWLNKLDRGEFSP